MMVYFTLQGLYHDQVKEDSIEDQIKAVFSSVASDKGLPFDMYEWGNTINNRNCLSVKYEPLQLSSYLPP